VLHYASGSQAFSAFCLDIIAETLRDCVIVNVAEIGALDITYDGHFQSGVSCQFIHVLICSHLI
jgi:hypothetical protein